MSLPTGYTLRKLLKSDYANGYIETLEGLTTVGTISKQKFEDLVEYWDSISELYKPHVITNKNGVVVATGMLLAEKKLIHDCGLVGHIEDISVAKSEQGKKLGYTMITSLTDLAKKAGCYKVILDCSPHNVGFYEKCGLKPDGIEMLLRF